MDRKNSNETIRRIDDYLNFCLDQWAELPELEDEIADWDFWSKVHAIIDWPITEDRTAQLEQYALSGAMNERQIARHEELKILVEKNRPIIDRLWKHYGL